MFREIFGFEVRYHLRQPLFYILLIVFFLLAFAAATSDSVTIGGAVGNVHRNAPFVIMQFLLVMSIFGVLSTTAYVASAAYRDIEHNTDSLFYSSPIRKVQFLAGRFFGSLLVATMVYFGVIGAIMIGSLMPWIDKERIGPFLLKPYLFSYVTIIVPNLFLFGAIFFAVALLTRSLLATYSSAVAFYVGYAAGAAALGNVENERLVALFDPFGVAPFSIATRYWTVFQKNTDILPLEGVFLWNRLLWIGVGAAVLAFAFLRFNATVGQRGGRKTKVEAEAAAGRISLALPQVRQTFGSGASFRTWLHATKVELASVLKSVPFLVMLMLAVLNTLGALSNVEEIFGTSIYPVTNSMNQAIEGSFLLFTLLLAGFYAGDIVWRERALKLNEVHDATPVPTWVIWAAKLTSLVIMVYLTLITAALTAISVQTYRGYHHYELGLYVRELLVNVGLRIVTVAIFAFAVQVLTNNKYVGFLAVLLYFVSLAALPAMHYEHHLYRLDTEPRAPYSDMNGFGHFVAPLTWFITYWLLFAALLLVAAHLLWIRGTGTEHRLRIARQRFGKGAITTAVVLTAAFASTGCYIYYNTNVLNHYETSDARERRLAEFEKKYRRYETLLQPRITDVQADVDIVPEHRSVAIRGHYLIANKTGAPIRDLHILHSRDWTTYSITIPTAHVQSDDKELGYTIYRLDPPMAPGATLPIDFRLTVENRGFRNDNENLELVANGTFFNNLTYFPHIGFANFDQLQDAGKRKKYGLPAVQRLKPPTDMLARRNCQISAEADWINLDTTVSTSPDQIAIAPGYLQKEWTANGRRYFHYKTTSPILAFWSYLSARYQVKRGQWHGIPIEIYYDAKHPYNVDRMIYAVQKSLDYFTANFSPYQHQQVRILEFPRYARFAQSFPNTIPFSESIGFIADVRDKEAIDYVFYVTAHEVGHQWWAHQVVGGSVQGDTMITETMAQYSALMVMEKEYGKLPMRKFLRYELDRYLQGRGGELVQEMPLELVEDQPYIHYRKGSLAMYRLRDEIGEDKVNAALSRFLHDHAFQGPPYPTAPELVEYFRAVTPPEKQGLIRDLFETITLYDNKTTEATATALPGGKYSVTIKVESKKLRADGRGVEKEIPIDDWIDVAVLGDSGKSSTHDDRILAVEKRHITTPSSTFTFIVNQKPTRAGIDPFNKLVDRNPEDNVKRL